MDGSTKSLDSGEGHGKKTTSVISARALSSWLFLTVGLFGAAMVFPSFPSRLIWSSEESLYYIKVKLNRVKHCK